MTVDLDKLKQALVDINQQPMSHRQPKQAAVLVPIIWDQHRPELLLTKRARHLRHHAGQISFPGGRYEPEDGWLGNAALREAEEEIGLSPDQVELLGKLPQQDTISKYNVTPYVGLLQSLPELTIDRGEVESAFTVPLDYLLAPENQQTITDRVNGQSYSFYLIRYNRRNIWGATARIIVNLSRRYHQL